ncbi:MAG: metallophosphoesterase family protein [Gomphosphaeria aponina SAG 52.96 = DSM 107014]|uniref:Metallophosphoesterase family protein n=1 Tax=Gomphosphaeria aponina SAG 52.96 = DSM 107014 TaxID=1521640 RepID=A0A941GSB1_9CHRO|nr:metallophosphoesterase family protein [Gomphosphaeria aponina SAG 52.96 = DSM 107014]
MESTMGLLSDPFLQLPTENSINVVWFTEFPGAQNLVNFGDNLQAQAIATTKKMTRLREDNEEQVVWRDVWRHEAVVGGLTQGKSVPYQVTSIKETGEKITSKVFSLSPLPQPGTPLKILLTSDHQLKAMTAANLQKVVETIGKVDGVFLAGDLVNIPDRASEWFDDHGGGAFFPCLQGKANYELGNTVYTGGELIQNAPLLAAIGNHEVMGRFSMTRSLNEQFDDSFPRKEAEIYYEKYAEKLNPGADPLVKEAWLKANSFNTDTYEEIFTLPQSIQGGKKYYAITFGDVRLVVLYATNMWRRPKVSPEVKGRYQERAADLNNPEKWGGGQHIFEPISKGSSQYLWLEEELKSKEFQQAKFKIVMFHHPVHTLGGNIVPPYTDPVARIETAPDGIIKSVNYDYPPENDYLMRDVMPLLEAAGVQLVFNGHSHLWNRFVSPSGIHFLETSNVGNSYGAHLGENKRPVPPNNPLNYAVIGDPNGLEPIMPNIAPLVDEVTGESLPYIASNEITVFSILDTGSGKISSYRFDTLQPRAKVIKFDEFGW